MTMLAMLTAEESLARQHCTAAALHAAGCVAGDRVAIRAHNCPDVVSASIGALRVGVVPVMVNPDLTAGEAAVILGDCAPQVVLDDDSLAPFLNAAPVDSWTGALADVPLARPMHYTSGTTGRPKGVWSGVLTPADASALLAEERDLWGFVAGDRNLVCSPLYHSAPLRFAAGTLMAGGSVAILPKFDARLAAQAIADHAISTAFMAPTHLHRIFELPESVRPSFATFRLLAHAGAPCLPVLKRMVVNAFPPGSVWEFYGATEGQFTACPSADWLERPGSVGRARQGRTLSVDPGTGVLWCQVPEYARFSYWNDPEKTAAAWRNDAFTVFDLGRIDADGYVYLDGRRDDLLITGGVNVYPLEVELALAEFPGVAEVAVFGVDDVRWGTRVCAAIVRFIADGEGRDTVCAPMKDGDADGDIDVEAIAAFASTVLAPHKRPKQFVFVDSIPKTPTGKVRRSRLAAELGVS